MAMNRQFQVFLLLTLLAAAATFVILKFDLSSSGTSTVTSLRQGTPTSAPFERQIPLLKAERLYPINEPLEFNPRFYEAAGKKWDDLSVGKSCLWQAGDDNPNGYWSCIDCGTNVSGVCQPLVPHGKCRATATMINWDVARPRKRSDYRQQAADHATGWIVTHWDLPTEYELPACNGDLALPCFDLDRCDNSEGPIKVFIHNSTGLEHLNSTGLEQLNEGMQDVFTLSSSHDDACLFVVHKHSFPTPQAMIHSPLYRAGQNHMIWLSSYMLGVHPDRPFPQHFNFELAALAGVSFTDGQFRPGYDISLYYPQKWRRPKKYDGLDIHAKRRLLLSFKGTFLSGPGWTMPLQHHRWLALEFWEEAPDILVDMACPMDGRDYQTGKDAYGELLLNSTFVFAPGGGGASSYRFIELLAAGAIPVVLSYLVPPFSPEVDWSGCLVKVAEARIPDIPRILRNIPAEEVRARQTRCHDLYEGLIGRQSFEDGWGMQSYWGNPFRVAMRIWQQRIHLALNRKDKLNQMEQLVLDQAASSSKGESNQSSLSNQSSFEMQ